MTEYLNELSDILERNKSECNRFMEMITPKIEDAKDEHERLYWHHIYEEEEQRLDRLNDLLPKIQDSLQSEERLSDDDKHFIHMLQDISLEKFGLHNFEEHLELGLYSFKEAEDKRKLEEIHKVTSTDYQRIKEILQSLNEQFSGSVVKAGAVPTDEKENNSLKATKYVAPEDTQSVSDTRKKKLTVGSLKKGGKF